MEPRSCRFHTLAQGPAATVQQCLDCGTLSLHIGPTTLRLDPATAEALWATLGEALHALHHRRLGVTSLLPGQA